MIPVLLLAGLLVGRWFVVAAAIVAWPLVLFVDGTCDLDCVPAAAGLAGANTAAGVLVHKALLWSIGAGKRVWRRRRAASPG